MGGGANTTVALRGDWSNSSLFINSLLLDDNVSVSQTEQVIRYRGNDYCHIQYYIPPPLHPRPPRCCCLCADISGATDRAV